MEEQRPMMFGLGVHVLTGETLLAMLHRVQEGEDAEAVYMEMYANAEHVTTADLEGDDVDGDV